MPLTSYTNTSVYGNETPGHPRHKLRVSGDHIRSGPLENKTVERLGKGSGARLERNIASGGIEQEWNGKVTRGREALLGPS